MRWLSKWFRTSSYARTVPRHRSTRRPVLEQLEDRTLLSVFFDGVPQWLDQGPAPTYNGQVFGLYTGGTLPSNPVSGAVESLAPDPFNANILFAASVNGGVWRTENALADTPHWDPRTDQQPSLAIGAIAFSPLDRDGAPFGPTTPLNMSVLFAGTGGSGLLESSDGGDNWAVVGATELSGKDVWSVVPGALDPDTGQQMILVATSSGLFRSANGGATFVPTSSTAAANWSDGRFSDLVADPGNPLRFYAALEQKGIFRSDDGGKTWNSFNNDITFTNGITGIGETLNVRLSVYNNAGDGTNAVYAGFIGYDGKLAGVFRSANQGDNWKQIGSPPDINPEGQGNNNNNLSIAADPYNPNVVFVGGDTRSSEPFYANIQRGDASSGDWGNVAYLNTELFSTPHADSRHLAFDANGNLLESDDGGIYRLANPDQIYRQWYSVVGDIAVARFYSVAYDNHSHVIFGGTQDTANVKQSTPGLRNWASTSTGDGAIVAIDRKSDPDASLRYTSRFLLQGFDRTEVDQNNNEGTPTDIGLYVTGTGHQLNENTGPNSPTFDTTLRDIQPFTLNTVDPKRMIIPTHFLYESSDRGDHLTSLGAYASDPSDTRSLIGGVAYGGYLNGQGNADVLYVGALNQLYLRTSGTGMPTPVNALPRGFSTPQVIVLDPDNWQTAFILDVNGRVWRTTDAGKTSGGWTELTGNLGGLATGLQTMEVCKAGSEFVLLVGGQGGIYRTIGPTTNPIWLKYGLDLPNVPVTDMHYDATDDILVVGTFGRGAWAIPHAGATLTIPAALEVNGDESGVTDDTIVLRLDPANANFIQVVVNGQLEYDNSYSFLASILINGDLGHDTIDIEAIPAGIAVTALGAETVNVGRAGTMIGIRGTLTVSNHGFTDLTVDDHLDLSPRNLTIDASSVRSPDWGNIFFEAKDLQSLTIYGGLAIFPFGSPNGNVFTINDTPSNPIVGLVTTLDSGSDKDVINVLATTGPLVINGGSLVDFGDASHNLNHLGLVTVNGYGKTTVKVDDSGNVLTLIGASTYVPLSTQYVVAAQQLTRSALLTKLPFGSPFDPLQEAYSSTINYSGLAGLTIASGALGAYSYQVNSTAGANSVTINAASPADTVTVGDAFHNLDAIGTLTVHGNGNGNTTLKVDDSGNLVTAIGSSFYVPLSTQYFIAAHQLTRSAFLTKLPFGSPFDPPQEAYSSAINYSDLAGLTIVGGPVGAYSYQVGSTSSTNNLTLSGGAVSNTFDLQGTSTGTSTIINAGSKADVINVGSAANSLDPIRGAITVNGRNGSGTLNIDDQSSTVPHTYMLTDTTLTRTGAAVITYGTLGALTVYGGSGGNTFQLQSSPAGPLTTLNSGRGPDTVVFADQAVVHGVLDGQDGFDTLDYRAYTTPAFVNLLTGVATGVTGSVHNFENVLGAGLVFTVTNTNDSGTGSLRQAILDANNRLGLDLINFAIPGGGVHTIAPTTPLPDITDPVTIDGYS